jgi:o-succinylbenzoate synthase
MVALSESFATRSDERALFLSNSMPIRDAEFFMYPMTKLSDVSGGPTCVGANRGASGIDGIISSALGFCESTETPTTLVIGDMAGLHDIGSFHSMADGPKQSHAQGKKRESLTTVVVNNDGGGIFSFLPIAKHGKDVSFEEFFGTPTSTFSFEKGAKSFGLPFRRATTFDLFQSQYRSAVDSRKDSILEAKVVDRQMNVAVHNKISESVESFVSSTLTRRQIDDRPDRLPIKIYTNQLNGTAPRKTMILLHGWMGDKLEWDRTVNFMIERLDRNWRIVSIDLPGHGGSPLSMSSDVQVLRRALRIDADEDVERKSRRFDLDAVAASVLETLSIHHHVEKIDALVGYSAGGRVALAMKRLCLSSATNNLITGETALVLLGAFPGDMRDDTSPEENVDQARRSKDEKLAKEIVSLCDKSHLSGSDTESSALMAGFLERWYRSPIWGGLDLSKQYKMIGRRTRHLLRRGKDLALFLVNSSPARNPHDDGRYCSLNRTLFIAGSLDVKYSAIGKEMNRKELAQYQEIEGCGHAVLTQCPRGVAERIVSFLSQECEETTVECLVRDESLSPIKSRDVDPERSRGETAAMKPSSVPVWAKPTDALDAIDSLKFVPFAIELIDGRKKKQVAGIGWGPQSRVSESSTLSTREGFVIQIVCANGLEVGLGEVSPLPGLHRETLKQAKNELELLELALSSADKEALPPFDAATVLAMNGTLSVVLRTLAQFAGLPKFVPSVRSGIEMALISLAAQKTSFPVHQALAAANESPLSVNARALGLLPLNGLITRAPSVDQASSFDQFSFPSYKVKVGHQELRDDTTAILSGFRRIEIYHGRLNGRIRADANRAWNESQTIAFAMALEGLDVNAFEKFEFIEEPLQKVKDGNSEWTLDVQVTALERSYFETAIAYALDESLADLAESHDWEFEKVKETLESTFKQGSRGCAALILKPSLLGMELSLRLARLARQQLGIGAVFSSSFDSGLGLAHAAFLGHISDQVPSKAKTYPHGLGTFSMLGSDTLIPAFGSYVNSEGSLNVPSMSRALYGLSIDEIQDSTSDTMSSQIRDSATETSAYEASTAQSSNGNEISVAVSFPLPFSAEIACSRFTDLPSMSRWSPWISSVRYLGAETEWTINIRGIPLTWRAASQVVSDPFPGIQWQSVSGLNNRGIVEFIADELTNNVPNTCTMNVRMTIVTPRVLRPLFQGTSLFLEEFLRNKLLKWSLEMFRDVVKADLALER